MSEQSKGYIPLPEAFSLADRVSVITGAGSGMGKACALTFAAAGSTVYALDLNGDALNSVAAEANGMTGKIIPIAIDATDDAAIEALLERVDREQGRIDVLFNHAGRACTPGMDLSNKDWLVSTDLNLRVPILLTSKALPLLRKSDAASLIYTASIAGLVASPNSPIYSAVKHAIIGFTKSVAATLGPEGIRANAICPGTMETPMLVDFFRGTAQIADKSKATREDVDAGIERFKVQVPLQRTGKPDEVAELALFLASKASRYVTGTAIPVDGGYVAK